MARGKRTPYTIYVECAFGDIIIFLRQKTKYFRKDAWYIFEVIDDVQTILKAKKQGFPIVRLDNPEQMPIEALAAYEKLRR